MNRSEHVGPRRLRGRIVHAGGETRGAIMGAGVCVGAVMGSALSDCRARICPVASNPSIRGHCHGISIASHEPLSAMLIAASPKRGEAWWESESESHSQLPSPSLARYGDHEPDVPAFPSLQPAFPDAGSPISKPSGGISGRDQRKPVPKTCGERVYYVANPNSSVTAIANEALLRASLHSIRGILSGPRPRAVSAGNKTIPAQVLR